MDVGPERGVGAWCFSEGVEGGYPSQIIEMRAAVRQTCLVNVVHAKVCANAPLNAR